MLLLNKKNHNYHLLVWRVTEPLAFFCSQLPENISSNLFDIKNKTVQLQKAATQHLLHQFYPNETLAYLPSGKPQLAHHYISISHSGNYVAILVSQTNCGVDIEKISEKTQKVKKRFLSETELSAFEHTNETLTLLWCVKETLYKFANIEGVDYKNRFKTEKIDFKNRIIFAKIDNQPISVYFKQIDDYFLTFTF